MGELADIIRAMDTTAWLLLVGAPLFIITVVALNIARYSKSVAQRPPGDVEAAWLANVDIWDFCLGIASLVIVFGVMEYLQLSGEVLVDTGDQRSGVIILGIAALLPFARRKVLKSRPPRLLPRNAWLRITSIVCGAVSVALAVVPLLKLKVLVATLRGVRATPPEPFAFVYAWMAAISALLFLIGASLALWERRRSRHQR